MRTTNMKKAIFKTALLAAVMAATMLFSVAAHAAAPGITGPTFNLVAQPAYLTQPDGAMVYSWGYGCNGNPGGYAPAAITSTFCNTMQVPGPTLIVTEGQTVTVNLVNNLPTAAGNTSILFPGFNVTASGGVTGLLTHEATPTASTTCVAASCATYTFVAGSPGTRAYYSGTQGDLQVEMGLYGAIIVLPNSVPSVCNTATIAANNTAARTHWHESDFRLAHAAYDHPDTCYDREYLFQFSEMDPKIHSQADAQVRALGNCVAGNAGCSLQVATEPYHPAYFLINGRSMPDDMDPNYAAQYPHQPYNGNPHMHPGELTLIRVIGQGRWQHPFHEHGNHVRILARDGNLILSKAATMTYGNGGTGAPLAGPLLFTTTTTPGLAFDGIFYWTGKGLNWDPYGHKSTSSDLSAKLPCTPDADGYNTGAPTAINYYEWCQDHNKPMEKAPFGDVTGGGPVTLPDPNLFAMGPWYSGSPYLGPDAASRGNSQAVGIPPSGTVANDPGSEAGFAFMWHSHNEREITTNNIFPGGMMMMMLVDSREFVIDESF
jgi:FtsP/CotA-like multicopper oxidase with cupredoxin domain